MLNILMREDLNLNENLNEFLKEWEYHTSVLTSSDIIEFYGFTKDPDTLRYMVVMDYANKACFKSRLLDFTSKKLNEVLESENSQAYHASHSDLNDCVIRDLRSLDESNSKKLNEIPESEDSQASVKANEMLVSEDLNDYIIKGLGSLDIKADEN
ncbi:kinase-like domain-containing protein [Rhizophagus irregularis DAOM 181602=DAOM 197198]|nr:kinase-like domain-containing protein [Rhizophagus irregularis DAOM 181602=DAOM 197198]